MTARKNPSQVDPQPEEKTLGQQLKEGIAGEQVQPGANDGTEPELAENPATDTELADAAEESMVTYHGPFGLREITAQQWQAAGVADMPTVLWERRTGFKVPKNVFTEQALQVLRQDQGFRVP